MKSIYLTATPLNNNAREIIDLINLLKTDETYQLLLRSWGDEREERASPHRPPSLGAVVIMIIMIIIIIYIYIYIYT